MCWEKVSLLSKMTPRLRQWGVGVRVELSKEKRKSLAVEARELGPITRMSDLLQLSLRKFVWSHELISERQFERVEWA